MTLRDRLLPPHGTAARRASGVQCLTALAFALAALVLVRVALKEPLYVVGVLYAAGFWVLAWRYPAAALLLIFAACPFQTDVSGGGLAKYSVAEVNVVLSVPVFVLHMIVRKRLPSAGPITIPVLIYFGVCGYSSWENWRGQDALLSLGQMFLYFFVVVALFASFAPRLEDLRAALCALVCVGTFLSVAGMATGFGFLGLNKNGLGASLSVSLLVAIELWLSTAGGRTRQILTLALSIIAVGLLASLSRGSWLGAAAGLVVIFGLRQQWKALARLLLTLLPLLAACWFLMPSDSRDYATDFGQGRYNIHARLDSIDFARTTYNRNQVYGEGVGLRKEFDATNVVWVTLAETGVLGLAAFLLIHVTFFGMVHQAKRRIAPTDPCFSFLTVGAALIADQLCHGMVDHYWSRGAIMAAWAAAGMSVGVYHRYRLNIMLAEPQPAAPEGNDEAKVAARQA